MTRIERVWICDDCGAEASVRGPHALDTPSSRRAPEGWWTWHGGHPDTAALCPLHRARGDRYVEARRAHSRVRSEALEPATARWRTALDLEDEAAMTAIALEFRAYDEAHPQPRFEDAR
jgi:hypothetical protein